MGKVLTAKPGVVKSIEGGIFGTTAAKKAQAEQMAKIGQQQVKEDVRAAEAEDEIARRKMMAESGRGGRSVLVKTSRSGTQQPVKQTMG